MKNLIKAIVDLTAALREHTAMMDIHAIAMADHTYELNMARD